LKGFRVKVKASRSQAARFVLRARTGFIIAAAAAAAVAIWCRCNVPVKANRLTPLRTYVCLPFSRMRGQQMLTRLKVPSSGRTKKPLDRSIHIAANRGDRMRSSGFFVRNDCIFN